MLQAMNTGHDGSLTTIHANTPRDALSRIETMIAMGATNLPERAMRQQIAAAIQIVIQQSRMSDGTRKVTSISEVTGMEGDVITMQEIFSFEGRVIAGRQGDRPLPCDRRAAEGVRAAQGVGGPPRRRHVRRRHGGPVMVIVLVLLAFVVGVALVMGGYTAIAKLPQMLLQRRLDTRLQEVSQPIERVDDTNTKMLKVQNVGPVPAVDRILAKHDQGLWARQVDRSVRDEAVAERRPAGRTRACRADGAGCRGHREIEAALPVGAAVGFSLPFVFLSFKRARRLRAFEEQFPDGLDLIRALKAGHAFATGLKMVADEMPEPVGPEFRKTFDEQNFGLPLKDALDNLTMRVLSLDVRFFATAVLIQRETGGNLAEILENLAHVVRERFKILRQVRLYPRTAGSPATCCSRSRRCCASRCPSSTLST